MGEPLGTGFLSSYHAQQPMGKRDYWVLGITAAVVMTIGFVSMMRQPENPVRTAPIAIPDATVSPKPDQSPALPKVNLNRNSIGKVALSSAMQRNRSREV